MLWYTGYVSEEHMHSEWKLTFLGVGCLLSSACFSTLQWAFLLLFSCFVKQEVSDWAPAHLPCRDPVGCFNHSYPETWGLLQLSGLQCLNTVSASLTCVGADCCRVGKTSHGGSLILGVWVLHLKYSEACPFPAPRRMSTTFVSPWSKREKAPVTCVLLKPGQLLGAFLWQELSILNIYSGTGWFCLRPEGWARPCTAMCLV